MANSNDWKDVDDWKDVPEAPEGGEDPVLQIMQEGQTAAAAPAKVPTRRAEAAVVGGGEGASFGMLSKIGGLVRSLAMPEYKAIELGEAAYPAPDDSSAAAFVKKRLLADAQAGLKQEAKVNNHVDRVKDYQTGLQEQHPNYSAAGELAGVGLTAAVPFSGGGNAYKALRAATTLKAAAVPAAQLAARGAVSGGASSAGYSGGDPLETAKGTALGGVMAPVGAAYPLVVGPVMAGKSVYDSMDPNMSEKDKALSRMGAGLTAAGSVVASASQFKNNKADKAAAAAKDALDAAQEPGNRRINRAESTLNEVKGLERNEYLRKIDATKKQAMDALNKKIDVLNAEYQRLRAQDPDVSALSAEAKNKAFRDRLMGRAKELGAANKAKAAQSEKLKALEAQLAEIDAEEAKLPARVSSKRAAEFQAQGGRLQTQRKYGEQFPDLAEPLPENIAAVDRKIAETFLKRTPEIIQDPDVMASQYGDELRGGLSQRRAAIRQAISALAEAPESEADAAVRVNPARRVPQEEVAALLKELDLEAPADVDVYDPAARLPLTSKGRSRWLNRNLLLADKVGLEIENPTDFDPSARIGKGAQRVAGSRDPLESTRAGSLGAAKRQGKDLPTSDSPDATPADDWVGKTFEGPRQTAREAMLEGRRKRIEGAIASLREENSEESILNKGERTLRQDTAINRAKAPTSAWGALVRGVDAVREKTTGIPVPSRQALNKNPAQAAYFKRVEKRFRTNEALAKHLPALEAAMSAAEPEDQEWLLKKIMEDPRAAAILAEEEGQ